jgi:hypothetical protein
MTYQLVASIVTPPPEDVVVLPGLWQSETEFVIEVFSPEGYAKQWRQAGYLFRIFDVPGVGLVTGEVIKLYLERRKVVFYPGSEPFKIEFRPVDWLCDYQVNLWVDPYSTGPGNGGNNPGQVFGEYEFFWQ